MDSPHHSSESPTQRDAPQTSYSYDPVGNRLTQVRGSTTSYAYDRADRITAAGATTITVNANGNTTAKGAESFTYNQPNRLKTATVGGATETYVYDGDGVRFSRQVGAGSPIRYVSDIDRGLPVTIDDGTRKYVYGLGIVYAVAGSTIEVYHPDRLGSVRAITDAAGAVTATYRTDEWGNPTTSTGSSTQPFRFTGESQDATGLVYLRARYYDPTLGRLVSRDRWPGSKRSPQSLNRFAYAQNNSTTRNDPSGLDPNTQAANRDCGFLGLACATPCHLASDPYGQRLHCPAPGVQNPLPGTGDLPEFGDPGLSISWDALARQLAEKALRDHWFQLPGELRDFEGLKDYIYGVVSGNYTERKMAPDGRTAYWDESTGIIVITDPNAPPGSAYQPDRGYGYYEDWPEVGPEPGG